MICLFTYKFSFFFVLFCNDCRIASEMHFCNHRGPASELLRRISNCIDYQSNLNGKPKDLINKIFRLRSNSSSKSVIKPKNNSQCGLV